MPPPVLSSPAHAPARIRFLAADRRSGRLRCGILAVLLVLGLARPGAAEPVARFRVAVERPELARAVPVQVDLDALRVPAGGGLVLHELRGAERQACPVQVATGPRRTLHWLVETGEGTAGERVFELTREPGAAAGAPLRLQSDDGVLSIRDRGRELLGYQFGVMAPPEGVAAAFARSGFIHPLRAPRGQVLTRVQPPDHFHHYGLWNPWTQVEFDGRTIDFWNLGKRQATVRFAQFAGQAAGPVFAEFRAVHEHVVLEESGERVALTELQAVRAYRSLNDTAYVVDLVMELAPAAGLPVRLLEYRYGGLGWRATEEWHKENSRVLTSEGLARAEADGSLARWCLVEGAVGGDEAGIVLMSHPANYNHPEPLRVWPEEAEHGRGDVFANFSPTKNRDWLLEPGQTYLLRYRLLVYNGRTDATRAEQAWRDYAFPATVEPLAGED